MKKQTEPQTLKEIGKIIKARRQEYRLGRILPYINAISQEQINKAASNYKARKIASINRNGDKYHFPPLRDATRHYIAWVEEDDAFKAGVKWVLKQLTKG